MQNVVPSGLLSFCTAPSIRLASLRDKVKQSANSEMRALYTPPPIPTRLLLDSQIPTGFY